jgi:hypothetical protein
MTRTEKTLNIVLRGTSNANVPFKDLRSLLLSLGIFERVRGNHYIYSKEGTEEILNLQPIGPKAKAYQVKQVQTVILKYKL